MDIAIQQQQQQQKQQQQQEKKVQEGRVHTNLPPDSLALRSECLEHKLEEKYSKSRDQLIKIGLSFSISGFKTGVSMDGSFEEEAAC